jgi:glycosyltransferase involved in cell wall biosynthesis
MKIIFDASPLLVNKTGVGYYAEQLVTELAKDFPEDLNMVGFYYNFLGRRNSSHLPRFKNLSYTNSSIIPSKVVYQLRRWGVEFPIELLALQRSDFILYDNFLSQPSLFHTPSAPVIHDLTYIDLPDYVSSKLRHDLIRFIPKAISRSSFVITVSEFCKKRIQDVYNVPSEKIIVTPIPPAKPKKLSNPRRTEIMEELGIKKPYLLFLGTIEPRKNIPNLIDAYTQLPKKLRENYTLVIAGGIGWNCEAEVTKLKEGKEQGHDILHLGYVNDEERSALYQGASLFVHASHYEGFGMPILEAMSYGIPCAISNIPIYHEVAATSAYYFDQDSPKAIAATIEKLLDDKQLLNYIGRKGLEHAKTYSWESVAKTLYAAIQKTVSLV